MGLGLVGEMKDQDHKPSTTASRNDEVLPELSVALLAEILNSADDAVVTVDESGAILAFNQAAHRIFGYTPAEIVGENLSLLIPPRARDVHGQHLVDFAKSPTSSRAMAQRSTISGVRRNGEEFPAEASISKVVSDGRIILTAFVRDVSERINTEHQLRQAVNEKEVLLGEIHHRVRNNLQVISSLLNLQARATDDQELRRAFADSQNRVQSMALIHQQLYESSSYANIDLADYIRRLTSHLMRAYGESVEHIHLNIEINDVSLAVSRATPCGLIVNELVSNSLKYAFVDGSPGTIYIRASAQPDKSICLAVGDDGPGLPSGVGFWNTKTLGLRLVRTLVRQLDGELELGDPPGTEFRMRFAPSDD